MKTRCSCKNHCRMKRTRTLTTNFWTCPNCGKVKRRLIKGFRQRWRRPDPVEMGMKPRDFRRTQNLCLGNLNRVMPLGEAIRILRPDLAEQLDKMEK